MLLGQLAVIMQGFEKAVLHDVLHRCARRHGLGTSKLLTTGVSHLQIKRRCPRLERRRLITHGRVVLTMGVPHAARLQRNKLTLDRISASSVCVGRQERADQ
jgi:hypothetical protein